MTRILRFIVDGLSIQPDPNCDFTNLVQGTDGYLKAEFVCNDEWSGLVKVASFYDGVNEYAVKLEDGKSCMIPYEATKRFAFGVRLVGKNSKRRIGTNKAIVVQNGGI